MGVSESANFTQSTTVESPEARSLSAAPKSTKAVALREPANSRVRVTRLKRSVPAVGPLRLPWMALGPWSTAFPSRGHQARSASVGTGGGLAIVTSAFSLVSCLPASDTTAQYVPTPARVRLETESVPEVAPEISKPSLNHW